MLHITMHHGRQECAACTPAVAQTGTYAVQARKFEAPAARPGELEVTVLVSCVHRPMRDARDPGALRAEKLR